MSSKRMGGDVEGELLRLEGLLFALDIVRAHDVDGRSGSAFHALDVLIEVAVEQVAVLREAMESGRAAVNGQVANPREPSQ